MAPENEKTILLVEDNPDDEALKMARPLRALIVEDSEDDALLMIRELGEQSYDVEWQQVETATDMHNALEGQAWDVVLSDYQMPRFGAPEALKLAHELDADLPFIVISGTIGEAIAVETMKAGAHDYFLKGKLAGLGQAIEREVREAGVRREQQRGAEKILHLNRVLEAIRSVNRLVARAKDMQELIDGVCRCLCEIRGYDAAWIGLIDDVTTFDLVSGCGYGELWDDLSGRLRRGKLPACVEAALSSPQVIWIDERGPECDGCPVFVAKGGHRTLAVRIEHEEHIFGVMAVTLFGERPLDDGESVLFGETAADIAFALRKLKLDGLRAESEERFRSVFHGVSEGILFADLESRRFTMANRAICDMLGYQKHEILGRGVEDIHPPDGLPLVIEAFEKQLAGEVCLATNLPVMRKDGSIFPADISSVPVRIRGRDGLLGCFHDVSERKSLQASVTQADRMASMGMLAAGVAHEINNPLVYVLYNLESLGEEIPKALESLRRCEVRVRERIGREQAEEIFEGTSMFSSALAVDDVRGQFSSALDGACRIAEIARGLGAFSRVDEKTLEPVILSNPIEAALNISFNELKYRARVVKDFGATPAVTATEGRLSQVLLNLLVNAAHAIDEGDIENNEVRVRTWTDDAGAACIEVRDTGSGIEDAHLEHLFEPFFTTKEIGVDSGLGLSISKSIVEGFGGTIAVESELGVGTSFTVRLPARKADSDARYSTLVGARDVEEPTGRILIVDDEEGIRHAMARMLRAHDTVLADSGAAAKRILEKDRDFELILCDMMMPEVSGMDLHRWLVDHDPKLAARLVFVSGGAFTPRTSEYLARVDNPSIAKPFDVKRLRSLVRQCVLAARRA